jgi:hypothetical protein
MNKGGFKEAVGGLPEVEGEVVEVGRIKIKIVDL